MGVAQIGSNAFIARNKIDGTGGWALSSVVFRGRRSDRNTFAWNDISEFKASTTDFLCLGNQNMFVGSTCKVVDQGKGNMMLTKY